MGGPGQPPDFFGPDYLTGSADTIASVLRDYADSGVAHVMCQYHPTTPVALERLGEALAATGRGSRRSRNQDRSNDLWGVQRVAFGHRDGGQQVHTVQRPPAPSRTNVNPIGMCEPLALGGVRLVTSYINVLRTQTAEQPGPVASHPGTFKPAPFCCR